MNLTPGGLLGYCSSKCIIKRKVPSSNGVSEGPMITAFLKECVREGPQFGASGIIMGSKECRGGFAAELSALICYATVPQAEEGQKRMSSMYHVMTLSATGDAETPAGGSVCMRWDELARLIVGWVGFSP